MTVRSDSSTAAKICADVVIHSELQALAVNIIRYCLKTARESLFVVNQFSVHSLKAVAAVI